MMLTVMERYIRGLPMRINSDIKDLGSSDARAAMRGYWEFRSQGRMTETRLFGFFARRGAFVATDFKGRHEFGGKDDPAWLLQRQRCEEKWKAVFGDKTYLSSPWPVRLRSDLPRYLDQIDD